MNSAHFLDFLLVIRTFQLQIGGVPVQDVDVFRVYVYVLEEILEHEVVVALAMVAGQIHVLVHVKCRYILKRHFSFFV